MGNNLITNSRNYWMITLHKEYVQLFIDKKKNVELRTRIPKNIKQGDIIIAAMAGSQRRVVFWMEVISIIKLPPGEMFRRYNQCTQLNYYKYFNYTKGHDYVYGIKVSNVTSFDKEMHTYDFGIKSAPQWFSKPRQLPTIFK